MNFTPLRQEMQRMLNQGVPGMELIVCQDHQILFHECAGYSDAGRLRPACPQDRYWLYSCTKPITACAAMRAMEQGLFSLNDPVARYLPAYKDVFLMKDGNRVKPETTMTIRHLMTMTAGLDYRLNCIPVGKAQEAADWQAGTVAIAQALAEKSLSFEPGERFQYSLCHDVLGAVIQAASGMTYREYLQEQFFRPLGMAHTDFSGMDRPEGLCDQFVYDSAENRVKPMAWDNNYVISPRFFGGGAGLVSTAEDYLIFADALACGGLGKNGARILTEDSINAMRTEQLSSFHATDAFSCTCGSDYGYGLGVRTRIAFDHGVKSALGEFGWDGAAGADLLVDPLHRLSMVYVQHVRNWPALQGPVHLQLRDILYPILEL